MLFQSYNVSGLIPENQILKKSSTKTENKPAKISQRNRNLYKSYTKPKQNNCTQMKLWQKTLINKTCLENCHDYINLMISMYIKYI